MIDLDRVKDYRVLLVGDGIIDVYQYVKPIGKAVKEEALSSLVGKREEFRGGVWAAAQHTLGFCSHVDVMTGDKVMWNTRLVSDTYLRKLHVMHELRESDRAAQDYDIGAYDVVIVTDFGHGTLTKE